MADTKNDPVLPELSLPHWVDKISAPIEKSVHSNKFLFDLIQGGQDILTLFLHKIAENADKEIPFSERKSTEEWDNQWKDYLERDLFKTLFKQAEENAKKNKKLPHSKRMPPIIGVRG